MSKAKNRLAGLLVAAVLATVSFGAMAQGLPKIKTTLGQRDVEARGDVARFCTNIGPAAAEARLAWQMRRLGELEAQINQRIANLQTKETEVREWVTTRQELLKKAEDGVVAIYGKMDPEAAAAQLAAMDGPVAAAILSKLSPRIASAILDEMDSAKAAALADLMSGNVAGDGKKS